MKNDPGLFTDSTGEGMAGAEDVSLSTQKDLRTQYNGDNSCTKCGMIIDPVQSLLNQKVCPSCSRKAQMTRVKGRMAE
jgi:predicted RNA-binding Zn-ribbon protein involved in translation (DUF1610 family)